MAVIFVGVTGLLATTLVTMGGFALVNAFIMAAAAGAISTFGFWLTQLGWKIANGLSNTRNSEDNQIVRRQEMVGFGIILLGFSLVVAPIVKLFNLAHKSSKERQNIENTIHQKRMEVLNREIEEAKLKLKLQEQENRRQLIERGINPDTRMPFDAEDSEADLMERFEGNDNLKSLPRTPTNSLPKDVSTPKTPAQGIKADYDAREIAFAKVIYGEAATSDYETMRMVGSSVINRYVGSPEEFGSEIEKVLAKRNGYYARQNKNQPYRQASRGDANDEAKYQQALQLARGLLNGDIKPVDKVQFYFTAKEVTKLQAKGTFDFSQVEYLGNFGKYRTYVYAKDSAEVAAQDVQAKMKLAFFERTRQAMNFIPLLLVGIGILKVMTGTASAAEAGAVTGTAVVATATFPVWGWVVIGVLAIAGSLLIYRFVKTYKTYRQERKAALEAARAKAGSIIKKLDKATRKDRIRALLDTDKAALGEDVSASLRSQIYAAVFKDFSNWLRNYVEDKKAMPSAEDRKEALTAIVAGFIHRYMLDEMKSRSRANKIEQVIDALWESVYRLRKKQGEAQSGDDSFRIQEIIRQRKATVDNLKRQLRQIAPGSQEQLPDLDAEFIAGLRAEVEAIAGGVDRIAHIVARGSDQAKIKGNIKKEANRTIDGLLAYVANARLSLFTTAHSNVIRVIMQGGKVVFSFIEEELKKLSEDEDSRNAITQTLGALIDNHNEAIAALREYAQPVPAAVPVQSVYRQPSRGNRGSALVGGLFALAVVSLGGVLAIPSMASPNNNAIDTNNFDTFLTGDASTVAGPLVDMMLGETNGTFMVSTMIGNPEYERISAAQISSSEPLTPEQVLAKAVQENHAAKARQEVMRALKQNAKAYTVVAGDNLGAIANKFKTTVELLQDLNGITSTKELRTGQQILIPSYGCRVVIDRDKAVMSLSVNDTASGKMIFEDEFTVGLGKMGEGEDYTPTPLGNYSIAGRERDPQWLYKNKQGEAVYYKKGDKLWPYGIGLLIHTSKDGIDLHSVNTDWMAEGHVSHGCVRLSDNLARTLWSLLTPGTPLEVTGNNPTNIYPQKAITFEGNSYYVVPAVEITASMPALGLSNAPSSRIKLVELNNQDDLERAMKNGLITAGQYIEMKNTNVAYAAQTVSWVDAIAARLSDEISRETGKRTEVMARITSGFQNPAYRYWTVQRNQNAALDSGHSMLLKVAEGSIVEASDSIDTVFFTKANGSVSNVPLARVYQAADEIVGARGEIGIYNDGHIHIGLARYVNGQPGRWQRGVNIIPAASINDPHQYAKSLSELS